MKILSAQTFAFVILLLFTLSAKAQNSDYVITTNGDTLACTITTPAFVQNGKYKTSGMDKSKQILMSEIKEYYISKDSALFRKVYKRPGKTGSAKFMVVLENGKINLYEEIINTTYMNPGMNGGMYTNSSTTWYLSKGSDTLKAIKNADFSISALFFKSRKSRENEFAEMIMDNKKVYDKYLADDKFSFKEVRNLVHVYNTGKPFKEPDPKPVTTKVRIGNRP